MRYALASLPILAAIEPIAAIDDLIKKGEKHGCGR